MHRSVPQSLRNDIFDICFVQSIDMYLGYVFSGFAAFDGWSYFFCVQGGRSTVCLFSLYCEGATCLCSNAPSPKLGQSQVVILSILLYIIYRCHCCYQFSSFNSFDRFINERIENLVISKANKGVVAAEEASQSKQNGSSKIPSDHFSRFLDPTVTGVELVQLKSNQSMNGTVGSDADTKTGSSVSKDPLLSIDTRSSRSWNSLPMNSQTKDDGGIQRFRSGGEWGEMLDIMSRRKTATLAPENLENMWAKGRNYRKKEDHFIEQVPQKSTVGKFVTGDNSKIPKSTGVDGGTKVDSSLAQNVHSVGIHRSSIENLPHRRYQNMSNSSQFASYHEDNEHGLMHVAEDESGSSSSYTSEEEDASSITGLDSPGTKVWDGKTNRNLAVSHIHHPLENHTGKKTGRRSSQYQRLSGLKSGRKRSRSSTQGVHVWQEIERTSFLSGDGQDILGTKAYAKADESTDDSDVESLDRVYSGTTASSISVPQNDSLTASSLKNSLMVDSFFRLRCEVLPLKAQGSLSFDCLTGFSCIDE